MGGTEQTYGFVPLKNPDLILLKILFRSYLLLGSAHYLGMC